MRRIVVKPDTNGKATTVLVNGRREVKAGTSLAFWERFFQTYDFQTGRPE